jgi:acyl-CoA reductase-like NAD-dependent aldehyde dehydrogenase
MRDAARSAMSPMAATIAATPRIQPPPARDAAPWIAGASAFPTNWVELRDPYRGDVAARVARSDADIVRAAIDAAERARSDVAGMPAYRRAAVLRRAADLIEGRAERYAAAITRQTGKALKNTLREVRRSAWTLRAAATAAETLGGHAFTSDAGPEGEGLVTLAIRQPVGIIGAVTPFNAPFNLVVHKVAPAFAAGNAIVVKPASQAPLAAIDVAQLMEDAGAPPGAIGVVPGDRHTVGHMTDDRRVVMFTLTGSRPAGESLLRAAGLRRVLLELGGNSPNIVHRDAPVEATARACVAGGFSNTGQSCNSVQRIIVHREIADAFTDRLVELVRSLSVGDPLDPATDVGTLVDEGAATRIESWLAEARERGARVVVGGERQGAQLLPAVVVDAPLDARLVCEEIFGPVVVVLTYEDLDEAIAQANATPYGLQAAIFTGSLDVAVRAARELESGAVLVNRSPNFRLDHLPYGGVKESGMGREGPAFAVREMTELKLVVVAPSEAGLA